MISGNSFCYVGLDVVVVENIVAVVEALRTEEFGHFHGGEFCICHDHAAIGYHLRVRAEVTEIGGPVCTDSCLEFFVMTDPSTGLYLNCEVNPLCVTHLAVGTGRGDRVVMRTLPAGMAMTHSDHRGRWWAVSYTLPAALLADRLGKGPAAGLTIRGNFYKCGDATEAAHYCMFKPYNTENPDYHRPEQFAEMRLIGE